MDEDQLLPIFHDILQSEPNEKTKIVLEKYLNNLRRHGIEKYLDFFGKSFFFLEREFTDEYKKGKDIVLVLKEYFEKKYEFAGLFSILNTERSGKYIFLEYKLSGRVAIRAYKIENDEVKFFVASDVFGISEMYRELCLTKYYESKK